jgi:isopenicillin N synthase-like dioxygenase
MAFRARVVDISAWVSGGVDRERTRSAVAIDEALTESTVVQIIGHGIPESVTDALSIAMDDLFTLDTDEKRSLLPPPGHNRGFTLAGSEALTRSLGLEAPVPDSFEAFTVGTEQADYPHAKTNGVAYAQSIWPSDPQFRRHVDTYFNEAGRVTRTLLNVLGDGLGVGRTYFAPFTDHSVDTMRLNHYPASAPSSIGMGAHTDFGFTTLCWADPEPGLQVASEGAWHDVVPEPGALLLFVGDLLGRTTNDRWKPTLHRVQHEAGVDRRSVVFYTDGNAESTVAPIAGLLAPGETPLYPPVTVGEHIAAKIAASRFGASYPGDERARARLPRG